MSGQRRHRRDRPGAPSVDRASSPAVVAGWIVMTLFLLAGLLTILLGVSAAAYENVFLGIVLPMALLGLAVGIVLLLRGS